MKAGVLALQGDSREHGAMFERLGAAPVEVRTAADLADVACLAIPGGESTTISRLARSHDLIEPLRERIGAGMPVLGTCAGLLVMARRVLDGEPLLWVLDVTVRRNAYGRQVDSFEADVELRAEGASASVRGVFIRAPVVEEVGPDVRVLAEHAGLPVVVEQGPLLGAAFHPELAGDDRLHRRLLQKV